MTFTDFEVQKWAFLPRRFANEPRADANTLRRKAFDFVQRAGIARPLGEEGLDPWEQVNVHPIDGADWSEGDDGVWSCWTFKIIQDYYSVMVGRAVLNGDNSAFETLQAQEGFNWSGGPGTVAESDFYLSAELWVCEVESEFDSLASFKEEVEKNFESLTNLSEHQWLATTFGAVAVPRDRELPWLITLWRGEHKRESARNTFVRTVWPLMVVRLLKCRLYAELIRNCFAEVTEKDSTKATNLLRTEVGTLSQHDIYSQRASVYEALDSLSKKLVQIREDELTLVRNAEGLEEITTGQPMFEPDRHAWMEEIVRPVVHDMDWITGQLSHLELTRTSLKEHTELLESRSYQVSGRWNTRIAILAAVFTAAGVGQLIPDDYLAVRFITVVSALVAILLLILLKKD